MTFGGKLDEPFREHVQQLAEVLIACQLYNTDNPGLVWLHKVEAQAQAGPPDFGNELRVQVFPGHMHF